MAPPSRNSCVSCARRKVKCDKQRPCSNCSKSQASCVYRAPAPSQRHRKRLTQGDLLSKIQELETLLHSHSIPFAPLCDSWINSRWEEKLIKSPQGQAAPVDIEFSTAEQPSTQGRGGSSRDIPAVEQRGAAQLWSELSDEVTLLDTFQKRTNLGTHEA